MMTHGHGIRVAYKKIVSVIFFTRSSNLNPQNEVGSRGLILS